MDAEWRVDVPQPGLPVQLPPELPDGSYPTRLDDRGRLRLPAPFVRFFESLVEKKLFVTTLDRRSVRIYPISIWREQRMRLASDHEDPDAADLLFLANHYGANTEMDGQGRILIHEDLRRALSLEDRPLMLVPWIWRVDVMPEDVYQARKASAEQDLDGKLKRLTAKGLR
jgi:MraZ protein